MPSTATRFPNAAPAPPQVRLAQLWHDKYFLAILLFGVLLRCAFLAVGAKAYYGAEHMFTNGDSGSYLMSFRNLVERGTYTFDFLEPEAAFGRLPGFPFFYGIHYYLFGVEHAVLATACSQALLDSLGIALVFLATARLASPRTSLAPYLAALFYAAYPFTIVWTSIMGTETLATFLTLLWFNTLLSARQQWLTYVVLGVEIALIFYVRDFLGLLLPVTCLYLLVVQRGNWPAALRSCVLVVVGFGSLYIWWPVRNYVFQHQVVLIKPVRAGFANYKGDMVGYLNWVHSWSNESTYWLQQALSNPHPDFPADIFASAQERQQAQALVEKTTDCGSSFYIYKHIGEPPPPGYHDIRETQDYLVECNDDIERGFEQLRASFKQRHPVVYYTRVPLQNLEKAFFKSARQGSGGVEKAQLVQTVLFGYRSALLLLGVLGLLVYRRTPGLWPLFGLWACLLVFMCEFYRQLEMRYLLQTDVLLLLPAALLLARWLAASKLGRQWAARAG